MWKWKNLVIKLVVTQGRKEKMDEITQVIKNLQVLSQTTLQEKVASNNQKSYECLNCKDEGGYITVKKAGQTILNADGSESLLNSEGEYWTICSCRETKKINKLINSSEITEEFSKMTFNNFEIENSPNIIKEMHNLTVNYYAAFDEIEKNVQNSIALLGQPGCGKTHLLTALCNNMISNKIRSILYFPFVDGFDDLRADFNKLEQKLNRMKEADILFIDDLFKPVTKTTKDGGRKKIPQASDWEIKQVYSVINHRYMNHKPIFVSSELVFNEIIHLDEAIGTRIYQMCKKYFIEIDKNSNLNYRLK